MRKIVYSQQAVVRIWRNWKNPVNLPTAHFGHAAVTITGTSVVTASDNTENISFWPGGDGASRRNGHKLLPGTSTDLAKEDKINEMSPLTALRVEVGTRQKTGDWYPTEWDRLLAERKVEPLPSRPGQKPAYNAPVGNPDRERVVFPEYFNLKDGTAVDVPMYFQIPNNNIYLPGMWARGCVWGLNLGRMATWWNQFKSGAMQYRALSTKQNCVGVALQGLIEGGAGSIVKPPSFKVYAEPVQLEQYAEKLRGRFLDLESMAKVLDMGIRRDHVGQTTPYKFELKDGIWMPDAWKRNSALGLLYSRSALISEIDRNVAAFYRLSWRHNFIERFEAFVNIFLGVCRHRLENNESKRSEGVAMLGKQVLAVLQKGGFADGFAPV